MQGRMIAIAITRPSTRLSLSSGPRNPASATDGIQSTRFWTDRKAILGWLAPKHFASGRDFDPASAAWARSDPTRAEIRTDFRLSALLCEREASPMNKAVQVLILLLVGASAAQLAPAPAGSEPATPGAAGASQPRILATSMPPLEPAPATVPAVVPAARLSLQVPTPPPPRFSEGSWQAVRIIHVVPGAASCGLEPRS
jgi:hypothetical protein